MPLYRDLLPPHTFPSRHYLLNPFVGGWLTFFVHISLPLRRTSPHILPLLSPTYGLRLSRRHFSLVVLISTFIIPPFVLWVC